MGHTKGPWRIDKVRTMNGAPIITASTSWMGNTREICKVLYHGGSEDPEVMDNAAVLAAAPDMLELLEEFARTIDDDHFYKDRLTAVLRKAKGAL